MQTDWSLLREVHSIKWMVLTDKSWYLSWPGLCCRWRGWCSIQLVSPLSTEDHPGWIKQLANEQLTGSLLWARKHPWEGTQHARIRKTEHMHRLGRHFISICVHTRTCAPSYTNTKRWNVILKGFACLQIFIIITAYVLQRWPRQFSTVCVPVSLPAGYGDGETQGWDKQN